MAKYRDHPTGEWPFYPTLEEGDIEHEYWKTKKMAHQAFINDRKGRIVVLMEFPRYKAFLDEVKKRKGNIWSVTIEEVMQEAIEEWMQKEE